MKLKIREHNRRIIALVRKSKIRGHSMRMLYHARNKLFLCIACTALCMQLTAQDFAIPKNRVPVRYDDFMAFVLVYDGKVKTSSLDNSRTYYWLKAKQIHNSKGGYEGDLLHGEYTALYRNDQLKEKGAYNKGLKTGEWKEWHINGELKLVSHYKHGFAHGPFLYYNETGKLIKKEYFRSGNLNGRQVVYNDTSEVVMKYRKGKLVMPKVKKKKERIKVEKGTEIKEPPKENEGSPDSYRERDPNKRLKKSKSKVARDEEQKQDKIKEMQPRKDKTKEDGRKKS